MSAALSAAKTAGVRISTVSIKHLDDVVKLAQEARGPVLFAFEHSRGAHAMVAFRNLVGQVRFADQLGRVLTQAETAIKIVRVLPTAGLVHESMVVTAFRTATLGQVVSGPAVTDMLTAPLYPITQEIMQRLKVISYRAAGKPLPKPKNN